MAEFVEKHCEDMIPELERIKLFDKKELRGIAKKRKDYEYNIQRHGKSKEDYLKYIQYEMSFLKLVQQRREKYGITNKKTDIDHAITNKINKLYIQAINRFKDDMRFWQAYMKFCKHVRFHRNMSTMIEEMLKTHQDNQKSWHIAARWEIEENKNIQNARRYLLRGLHFHPTSQLLFTDAFRLELNEVDLIENQKETTDLTAKSPVVTDSESMTLKRATVIYQQSTKLIKNVSYTIKLLDITTEHKNTEKLQKIIIDDLIDKFTYEPEMWDTMARRELKGLPYNDQQDETCMDMDDSSSLRDRITSCNLAYQSAVKKIKTETMWSLYLDCLLEINQDMTTLPNYKKKLLKSALMQGHQANKLREKYYLHWIEILKNDKREENGREKLYEILCNATDSLPTSTSLWKERLMYLITSGQDELAMAEFDNAFKILGANALPLWRMKILHTQAKNPNKVEEVFRTAMLENDALAVAMKPAYIEWLVLTKGIQLARQRYNELSLQPPLCLEIHKKMAALELIQPEVCTQSARRPHETATMQFGKTSTEVWIDYILFEMKYGEPSKITDIHRRAIKTLDVLLSDIFSSEYSIIKANSESIRS